MESEGFSHLDSAGDARIRLWAPTLEGIFRVAARGFGALVSNPASVRATERMEIILDAPDREELLVAWMNELVYLLDTREFFPVRAEMGSVTETSLEAAVLGEGYDPARHERRVLVKAATYHGLFIRESDEGFTAEITLDL